MQHRFEPDPKFGTRARDVSYYGGRRCTKCGLVQRKVQEQSWQRVVGYHWRPRAGKCVKLKWKRAEFAHQSTHCGRYWVERDPDGGHFGRWHAHREGFGEQLTADGFRTREEAKRHCEQDAREPDSNQ